MPASKAEDINSCQSGFSSETVNTLLNVFKRSTISIHAACHESDQHNMEDKDILSLTCRGIMKILAKRIYNSCWIPIYNILVNENTRAKVDVTPLLNTTVKQKFYAIVRASWQQDQSYTTEHHLNCQKTGGK